MTSTLSVRIPSWALQNEPPSALYRYAASIDEKPSIRVNGREAALDITDGYVDIRRRWQKGDVVTVTLPMPARRVLANDKVTEDKGKAVIGRGPIVYALEAIDNGGSLKDVTIPIATPLTSTFRSDLLKGVQVITGKVGDRTITAIPYYAWNNRGKGEMAVWIPY